MISLSNDEWKGTSIPPSVFSFGEGEIDLWRVKLDSDPAYIDSLFELLSTDEKVRANKYVFAKDRLHFIAGRGSLRKIISGYLDIYPEKIRFSVLRFGKPYLAEPVSDLRFNVSHSHGLAVIAVSRNRELGVDIEFVDRNFDVLSVAPSVFSAPEVSRIRSLPSNLRAETFFGGWTRKEAFLKAMGDGLSTSEELQTAVALISDENASFRLFKNGKFTDWSLTSIGIHPDFKATLVIEGKIGKVRLLQLAREDGLTSSSEPRFSESDFPGFDNSYLQVTGRSSGAAGTDVH